MITPIETDGGKKLVVVPTSETTPVVVESRPPMGFDTGLSKVGPLVYLVDRTISTIQGPMSVGQIITYDGVSNKAARPRTWQRESYGP